MIELNKIYNIDCLEGMKNLPDNSIDLILCDLPYNMTSISWDSLIPFDKLWEQYKRIIKPNGNVVLFSAGMFTYQLIQSNIKDFRYKLIWKKNVPTGMGSAKYRPMKYYEEICVFGNSKATYNPIMKERVGVGKACYNYDHYCGDNNHLQFGKQKKRYDPDWVQPSDVLEFNVVPNRNGKLHPTQKPVELLEYLIKTYSNEGDVVLDNCMGSGSTAIAAINTNRSYIGYEMNEEYYNKSINRIKELHNELLMKY
jgi:site-specific DNA-methyltransferase (adenine-specific)